MSRELTVQRRSYSLPVQALDALAGAFGPMLGLTTIEADSLRRGAERATGLRDYGDPRYEEGMSIILENARKVPITNLARVFIRETYRKALVQRLELTEHLKHHPEVLEIPVQKPVFVLGFPRSGTTLVQNLLGVVPGRRGLPFWQLTTPLPQHADRARDEKIRMRTAQTILRLGYLVAPEMGAVHHVTPTSLEECWYLFCNSFAVLNWDIQTGLEDYGRWLLDTDMTYAYREYRTWLQVLLAHDPAQTLLLKCPEHLWFVDPLLDVFPDGCIVWTHRDPVASIASYCSLMSLTRRMLYGTFDPHALGALVTQRFLQGVERAMDAMDRHDPARFYHVGFRDLLQDPKGVVKDIVRHFDLEDPPDHDALLDAALAAKRDDELGKHVYSAKMYGLDADAIHAAYARYIQRFQIPIKKDHG